MDIAKEIKSSFAKGSIVTRLIYINVAVFIVVRLLNTILVLTGFDAGEGGLVLPWLSVPASVSELVFKPWTLITYMFLQFGFIHLLVNMLMLYWFGRIFLQLFRSQQLLGLYLFGGITGGLMYVLLYNIFPSFC